MMSERQFREREGPEVASWQRTCNHKALYGFLCQKRGIGFSRLLERPPAILLSQHRANSRCPLERSQGDKTPVELFASGCAEVEPTGLLP